MFCEDESSTDCWAAGKRGDCDCRTRITGVLPSVDAATSISGHHVDLAVERVPPGVVALALEDVEEEVAVLAERATGVVDAHAILTAGVAFLRARVDEGDEFPAALPRVSLVGGRGVEAGVRAVADV